MALAILLLGPPGLARDGWSISALRSGKALALLAYLAVESSQAHRRDKLAGLL